MPIVTMSGPLPFLDSAIRALKATVLTPDTGDRALAAQRAAMSAGGGGGISVPGLGVSASLAVGAGAPSPAVTQTALQRAAARMFAGPSAPVYNAKPAPTRPWDTQAARDSIFASVARPASSGPAITRVAEDAASGGAYDGGGGGFASRGGGLDRETGGASPENAGTSAFSAGGHLSAPDWAFIAGGVAVLAAAGYFVWKKRSR